MGPVVVPLVGHHGRRSLSVEFRKTSQTFVKVVTKGRTEGRKPEAERTWELGRAMSNDQKGILGLEKRGR